MGFEGVKIILASSRDVLLIFTSAGVKYHVAAVQSLQVLHHSTVQIVVLIPFGSKSPFWLL